MRQSTEDTIVATLRSPVPRAAFAAALFNQLAQRSQLPVIAMQLDAAASRAPWIVAGSVAGALGAGIALIGFRKHRRGAA